MFTNYVLTITDLKLGTSKDMLFHNGHSMQSFLHSAYGVFADYYDIAMSLTFYVAHHMYSCKITRQC